MLERELEEGDPSLNEITVVLALLCGVAHGALAQINSCKYL